MDPRLQTIIDHHEISQVLKEYCHGCDRLDQVRMASVYREDSWDDHGEDRNTGPKFVENMSHIMATRTNSVSHLLGQSMIKVNGDEAGAQTYFIAVVRANADGREVLNQMGGRYVDTLVREAGVWKIKQRICVRDWSISLPLERDWLQGKDFVEGQRSNSDPSYAVLGLQHSGLPDANRR